MAKKVKEIEVVINGKSSGLQAEANKAASSVDKMGSSIKKVIAGIAIGKFIKDSADAFIRQEAAIAQLEQRLKSTGGAAGLTSQEIQKMAASLQSVTTYGDEAIIEGQNLLLTFTKIGKDTFPAATEAMLDMSTAMGQDLKSSAVQIGKALNDPIQGISALSRVGVQLSEQQKAQIKSFMAVNDVASAQGIILKELSTQMGGSARAAANTFGGSIQQLQNSFGDFQESLGAGLASSEGFRDGIDSLKKIFEDPSFVEGIKNIGVAIADVGGILLKGINIIGQYATAWAEYRQMAKYEGEKEDMARDVVAQIQDRQEALKGLLANMSEASPLHARYSKELEILGKVEAEAAENAKKLFKESDQNNLSLRTSQAVLGGTQQAMLKYRHELMAVTDATEEGAESSKGAKPPIDALNRTYTSSIAIFDDFAKANKNAAGSADHNKKAIEEQEKALKALDAQYLDNISTITQHRGETRTMAQAQQAAVDKIAAMKVPLKEVKYQIELTANETGAMANKMKQARKPSMSLKDSLDLIASAAGNTLNMLDQMGVKTGKVGKGLVGIGEGVAGFAASLKSGDIKGMIAGATKAIGSLFAMLKGKSGELKALERITQGLDISKDTKKAWEEEAKALGGAASAERVMNKHLAELIGTAKAGSPVFENLIRKTRDIWAVYEWGNVSLDETVDSYTAAYKAITDQVMASGKLSYAYIDLIKQVEALKAEGIELAEISELQAQIMQEGLQGYRDYLAGEFSGTTIAVFEEMIAKQQELADHSKIINGVKGLEKALMSLSATQTVTADEFDQFTTAALDGFNAMIEDGVSSNTALEQIAPTLSRLIELSNLYGFEIDEATQAIINQAQEAGISLEKQIDPTERMANSMEELVSIMKMMLGVTDDMSDSFRNMGKSAADAFREAGDAAKGYGHVSRSALPGEGGLTVPGIPAGPGFATGGSFTVPSGFPNDTYPIRVSSGEHVTVTPAGEGRRGEVNVHVTYNVSGIGDQALVRAVKDGVKQNKADLAETIKKAIK